MIAPAPAPIPAPMPAPCWAGVQLVKEKEAAAMKARDGGDGQGDACDDQAGMRGFTLAR